MKLLIDEPLSRKLVPPLQSVFPGTSHVLLHGLGSNDDRVIWDFARAGGFAILSKDDDFEALSFTRRHPPKVVWLRTGNGPTRQVLEILLRARAIIEAFGDDEDRSLLMLP